jgi:hypothetical protein
MKNRPEWWSFELELSGHILERMLDRGFSEADLRLMFETASLVWAGRLRAAGLWRPYTSENLGKSLLNLTIQNVSS